MSISFTGQDVLDRVAFRLHLPAFAAGEFVSDSEGLMLVQDSVGRLSGLLTKLYSDSHFAETATLTTVADFDIVSLPSDFFTLRSVHWVYNDTAYELQPSNAATYDPESRTWSTHCLPSYRVEANVLVLSPIPDASYTLRCAYTSHLVMEAITDSINGQPAWREWLVLDVCQRVRDREQKDASELISQRLELESQMKEQASQVDRYGSRQVRDVRGELNRSRYLVRTRPWLRF